MTAACRVYLIRHAESMANIGPDNIGGRNPETPLTAKGIEQAKSLGEHFKKENVHFSQVYTSTAIRAQETAQHCLEQMGAASMWEATDSLSEQDAGDWVGKSRAIYQRPDVRQALDSDNWSFVPGDNIKGESQQAVAQRLKEWLEKMAIQGQTIAAFTHGNAIKYTLADLFGMSRKDAFKIPIDNTSITILRYQEGKWFLEVQNSLPHHMGDL